MGIEKGKKKLQKRGLWSPDEDQRLREYVVKNGHGCWASLPKNAGLDRNGKSCRLRWINYLRPGLKRGAFSVAEVDTILTLHRILGNKWSQIAQHLPGRSDNEIKNYWHSRLKKRLVAQTAKLWSSSESSVLEHKKGSGTDEECMQVQQIGASLPKVLFAEWISFDESCGLLSNVERKHSSSNHQDTLFDGLLGNGQAGTFGVDMSPNYSQVYVDDMLHFDYQLDYFPGSELCINYDHFK